MRKNKRNKKIITYSAGSITLKGFIAFQIIPEIFIPIKRSSETIRITLKVANKPDTKNIFNLITPLGILFPLLFYSLQILIPVGKCSSSHLKTASNGIKWQLLGIISNIG